MQELSFDEFPRSRPLFDDFDYSLSVQAAIEGNNPGRIFVDDADRPRTAFALTVEGYLLAGEHNNPATNEALGCLLSEKIFSGEVYVNGDWSMSLAVHPQAWETKLPELIPTHEIEKNKRYHYLCDTLHFDWRGNIPEGYTVRCLDQALLDDPEITFPEMIREWIDIKELWWSMDNFLAKGISYVVLHDREIVVWCTPDCLAGDRIDVGIITHPAHRRRGLASIAVAATVEHYLNQGFSAVGWHCNAQNVASWKTAEKVGFRRNREYAYYYYMYDPIDHLADLGWYTYRHEEYAKTVEYYDQVFALRNENPDYYYHLAASAWAILENGEKALEYLSAAADHGWTRFVSMQNHLNLLYREEEREMMPLCRAEKIAVTPYSPLASGRLARDRTETTKRLETDKFAMSKYDATIDVDKLVVERVAEVAEKLSTPRAQIAFAWLLQKEPVVAPVIGVTKISHLENAVESLSIKLTPEEIAFMEEPYVPHQIVGHS